MVAKGEYDLMANRSHRRLPTLRKVQAHQHEAAGMIRDSGARISIMATGATHAPKKQAGYMTATRSPSIPFHPCTRAGSIYELFSLTLTRLTCYKSGMDNTRKHRPAARNMKCNFDGTKLRLVVYRSLDHNR